MKPFFSFCILLFGAITLSASTPTPTLEEKFRDAILSLNRAKYVTSQLTGINFTTKDPVRKEMLLQSKKCEVRTSANKEQIGGSQCGFNYLNTVDSEHGISQSNYAVTDSQYFALNALSSFEENEKLMEVINGDVETKDNTINGELIHGRLGHVPFSFKTHHEKSATIFINSFEFNFQFDQVGVVNLAMGGHFQNNKKVYDKMICKWQKSTTSCRKVINLLAMDITKIDDLQTLEFFQ